MNKQTLRKLILTAIFAAIISIASPFTIPIGPVPVTLSVLAVFLCGAILPPLYAMSATLVYIALGAVGLPVFSNFEGGFAKLIGPTGGFIWAYPIMALIIAFSVKIFKKRSIISLASGMTAALAICYLFGTSWFCYLTGNDFSKGLSLCVLPFIAADLLKAAAAITLCIGLNKTQLFNKL